MVSHVLADAVPGSRVLSGSRATAASALRPLTAAAENTVIELLVDHGKRMFGHGDVWR
ncbi:MAG TPA: hypothetical protein VGL78_15900 [Solirubrobacteraceae bacterium]